MLTVLRCHPPQAHCEPGKKPCRLFSLNKQWLRSTGIRDLAKSIHQTAGNGPIAPTTAENSKYSHYFDAGLEVLC